MFYSMLHPGRHCRPAFRIGCRIFTCPLLSCCPAMAYYKVLRIYVQVHLHGHRSVLGVSLAMLPGCPLECKLSLLVSLPLACYQANLCAYLTVCLPDTLRCVARCKCIVHGADPHPRRASCADPCPFGRLRLLQIKMSGDPQERLTGSPPQKKKQMLCQERKEREKRGARVMAWCNGTAVSKRLMRWATLRYAALLWF